MTLHCITDQCSAISEKHPAEDRNKQTHSHTLCGERETLDHSALNPLSPSNFFPLRAEETMLKRRQKECKSQRGWRTRNQQVLCTLELTETACAGLHGSAPDGVPEAMITLVLSNGVSGDSS